MKLSEHTQSVLKNFATINQNLVIKQGKNLSTMSAMKNIIASATSQEPIHQSVFSAYCQGKIKSLGAWGGDFILVTSKNNDLSFFKNKGYNTILKLSELVYVN